MQINDVFSRNIDYGTEIQTWLDERRRKIAEQRAAALKAAEEQQYKREQDQLAENWKQKRYDLDVRKQDATEEMDDVQMRNYNSLIKSRDYALEKLKKEGDQYIEIPDPLNPKRTLKGTVSQYLNYANRKLQEESDRGTIPWDAETELNQQFKNFFTSKQMKGNKAVYSPNVNPDTIAAFNRQANRIGMGVHPFQLDGWTEKGWGTSNTGKITVPVLYDPQTGEIDERAILFSLKNIYQMSDEDALLTLKKNAGVNY